MTLMYRNTVKLLGTIVAIEHNKRDYINVTLETKEIGSEDREIYERHIVRVYEGKLQDSFEKEISVNDRIEVHGRLHPTDPAHYADGSYVTALQIMSFLDSD